LKAAVLHAKRDLRYEDYPDPVLKEGEVLIRVRAAGICGSDLPRVLGDGAHFFPVVLGHEFSGEVAAIAGGADTALRVGDKVTAAPLKPCHACEDCARGWYSLCKRYSFIGSREQGAFAEYVAAPAGNVVRLPDNADFVAAALIEPMTVALHGFSLLGAGGGTVAGDGADVGDGTAAARSGIAGQDVAIVGCGTIGILAILCARQLGARRVAALDISPERLSLARKMGADAVYLSDDAEQGEYAYANVGAGYSRVMETAGAEEAVTTCLAIAANRGRVMLVGTPTRDVCFTVKEFETLNRKELYMGGSWMSYSAPFPGGEWLEAARLLGGGEIDVGGLIDACVPLSDAAAQFNRYLTPGDVKGKIILLP